MPPLRPGVFRDLFAASEAKAVAAAAVGLTAAGELVVEETRQSFTGQHAYRTPSPASPGGPPSRISETLTNSIHATPPEADGAGWSVKVGPQPASPTYRRGGADSSQYGYYLEVSGAGKSHVKYPFLRPAFRRVVDGGKVLECFRGLDWT